ncbi:hypothetical protein ACFWVC_11400 [Streptomyces sp. NPDC058691]|uniref:hypothetical protein n=1 Tax=Streptomyces sp. NPDC058691 TaxID=3346601 RepID=UPI0036544378
MGRRLATAVHIEHPETHELLILQPGDEPDEVVATAITNPDAWEEDPEALTLDDPALIGATPPTLAFDDPGPEPQPAPEPEPTPEAQPVPEPMPAPTRTRTPEAEAEPKPQPRARKQADEK